MENVLEKIIGLDSEFMNDDEFADDTRESGKGTPFKLDKMNQLHGQ